MKLVFIYNANSGKLNALFDIGHKLISPNTYNCSLCALTHDVFKENTIWKEFRKESHFDMAFYHKDEFEIEFPNVKFSYPAVLKFQDNAFLPVLNPGMISKIQNIEDFIEQIKLQLSN